MIGDDERTIGAIARDIEQRPGDARESCATAALAAAMKGEAQGYDTRIVKLRVEGMPAHALTEYSRHGQVVGYSTWGRFYASVDAVLREAGVISHAVTVERCDIETFARLRFGGGGPSA